MKVAKNYKNYLKQAKKDLVKYSIEKEDSIKKFKQRVEIINAKTHNIIQLQHNPLQDTKDNYLWFVYNQKLLEEKMTKDGNYTTLFITLTLPSEYHKYSSHTQQYNHNYKKENTINQGYKLLNKSFRSVYKNFRVNRKHQKIFFSKVIEPHKDLTCHLHAIIYVETKHLEKLKQHILKTIKNNNLGRYDIEKIKDISRSTSYLLKYVQKTTNPQNEKDFHFFNGWKKKNKIRVFTHSNLDLPRYIFKKVNSILKLSQGLKDKNPISEVLDQCNITVNTKDKRTKEITIKKWENTNARFKVVINRTRSVYNIKNKYSIYEEKLVSYFELKSLLKHKKLKRSDIIDTIGLGIKIDQCEDFETNEKIYDYKVNNFIITDLSTNEILYNKNDFMLLDDYKYKMYLNKS